MFADWVPYCAVAIFAAVSYLLSGALGIWIMRTILAPKFHKATFLHSVPVRIGATSRWRNGFIRESPGGRVLKYYVKVHERGLLIRQHLALFQVLRPRTILVPWDAISDWKSTKLPWYVSCEEQVELRVHLRRERGPDDTLSFFVYIPGKMYHSCFPVSRVADLRAGNSAGGGVGGQ